MGHCLSSNVQQETPTPKEIKYVSSIAILLVDGYLRELSSTAFIIDDISHLILEYYSENRTTINRIGGVSYKVAGSGNFCETITSLTKLAWYHKDSPCDICNIYAIDSMLITAFFTLQTNGVLSIYCNKKSTPMHWYDSTKIHETYQQRMIKQYTLNNIDQICYIHQQSGTHICAIIPNIKTKDLLCIGFINNNGLFPDEDLSIYDYNGDIVRFVQIEFVENKMEESKHNEIKYIKKMLMNDKMLYLLTNNGKLYQRGVDGVYKQRQSYYNNNNNNNMQSNVARFHQPASMTKGRYSKIIISDMVCNDYVSFLVDIDGHLLGKGQDNYGLLPNKCIGYKYFAPFHDGDNGYVHVKGINVGLHHVVVLDVNKMLYVWGSNSKKQLGFIDCCGATFACSCRYNIPQKLEIIEEQRKKKKKRIQDTEDTVFVRHCDVNVCDNSNDGIQFDDIICGDDHTFLVMNDECRVYGFGANNCNQCLLFDYDDCDMKMIKDYILPTKMTVIEKMMKYNKSARIIVRGEATYIAVKHY